MPRNLACFLCHGLLIGHPIDQLAAFLNTHTPTDVHFKTVGGIDPHPHQGQITQQVVDAQRAGAEVIFGGHSLGAMLTFYLADQLKTLGIRAPLFFSLDPPNCGSNAPGTTPWAHLSGRPDAANWLVPNNIDCWLHFWQPAGGSQAALAPGNTATDFSSHEVNTGHLGVPTAPQVEQLILEAVLAVVGQAVAEGGA